MAGKKNKTTKTNQEEAGNESNSCITSNTLSSKLHNIKNQAHSGFSTSKPRQHRGDTAEPAEPCPHSEAQHAPTLLFISILCPLLSSLGYLLPQSRTALWVRERPGGNTHTDFPPREQHRPNTGILGILSTTLFYITCIHFSVCVWKPVTTMEAMKPHFLFEILSQPKTHVAFQLHPFICSFGFWIDFKLYVI